MNVFQQTECLAAGVSDSRTGPRIAIARLSAIGDAIMTLPMACALREHYPDAFIAWIAEPGAGSILKGHVCIDQLVVVPKGWLKSPRTVLRLRKQLQSMQLDVALDPQSLSKSAIVAWLTGARQRIGFQSPRGRELSLLLNNVRHRLQQPHGVDAQLELLQYLGIENPSVRFDIPQDADAENKVGEWLKQAEIDGPIVAITPGAGWASKQWPAERFGAVARYLGEHHGMQSIIVWAGEAERALANEAAQVGSSTAVVAPATSLPELTALLRRSKMFISADTGPAHLAAAVGVPVVGLFGPTLPEVTGPYGAAHVAVQAFHQTGRAVRRTAQNTAMLAISVEEVCEACDQVLQCSNKAAPAA